MSQYGEWISFELNTFLAALTHKNANILAWRLTLNICSYLYYFIQGMVICLRTYTLIEIGQFNMNGMYQINKSCIVYSIILIFFISTFFQIITPYIIGLYSNDPEVLRLLETSLRIYCFVIYIDFLYNNLNTLIRIIRKEQIQFLISAVLGPIISLVTGIHYV